MVTQRPLDDIGLRVDALRADRGVSAQKLANESNIPYATLLRRLAGDGQLTVAELFRISRVLEVTTTSWFEVSA